MFLAFLLAWSLVSAQHTPQSGLSDQDIQTSRTEATFIENAGQVHDQNGQYRTDVLFMGISSKSQMVISNWGYSHQLHAAHFNSQKSGNLHPGKKLRKVDSVEFARVDLKWVGANSQVQVEKMNPTLRTFNHYNLPDKPDGITGVKEFEAVRIGGIYPGIDVRYYDAGGLFEHDYELAPGADYHDIRIKISGTNAHLNTKGELVLQTPFGTITESSPRVFQNGEELHSKWVQLENNIWGFEIPDANPELAMVIDPISRVWGTYYGGSNLDEILYSKFDSGGNLYVMGGSQSVNNIATTGTEQIVNGGSLDAFLAKFNEDGDQLWGTFTGGSNEEELWGCDFDEEGNIYTTGRTNSNNNISTTGSHQETYGGGGFDGFVQKFDSDGIRIWGTYYGGEEYDRGRYCHIDAAGFLYMAGVTKSFNNISTPGCHQEVYGGAGSNEQDDAILVKFTLDGERIWGTYYGGTNWEEGYSCDTDSELNVYLFGHAQSSTNISTVGSHQPIHGGGVWDSFLVKFDPEGVREWGTYIGGSNQDLSWACSIDENNSIYVTGRSASVNGISTPGAYQENNGGDFDAYLMKFSAEGEQIWGTYLGGTQYDRGFGCQAIENGKILVSGQTASSEGIATTEVHQEAFGGGIDAFLALFDQDGSLDWSTYYGGAQNDVGRSSTYFNQAYYLAGWTHSGANISTDGIHQEDYAGARDGFIVKFAECNTSYNQLEIMTCEDYIAPDGEVYDESGEYTATLQDQLGCDSIITINLIISDQIINDQYHFICEGELLTLPDGTTTSEEGVTTNEYISFQGCDSLVNHYVSIAPDFEHDIDTTICENAILIDPNGNPIDQAGEYSFLYNTIHGCDSIVHLELDFIPTYNTSLSATICEGDYFLAPNGEQIYTSGTYEYTLESSNGCDSVVTYKVNVNASPIAHFSTAPSGGSDVFETSIQFYNESVGEDYIFWDFFEYGSSDQLNPIIEYTDSAGVHPVCMYAYTEEGCVDSVCVDYSIIEELTIYIPNSFTPNGDGINDLFYVVGEGIDPDDFLMRVFNRWGEVVFESNDFQKKWDGAEPARTHYAQNEVYTYQVLVGALYGTDKKEIVGRVTVIR